MAPQTSAQPQTGLLKKRAAASVVLYAVVVSVLYRQFQASGMIDLLGSHLRAAPWNVLSPPCGLLEAKEFVVMSDRVVTPDGQAVPGAGERPNGPALACADTPLAAAPAVPFCLLPPCGSPAWARQPAFIPIH